MLYTEGRPSPSPCDNDAFIRPVPPPQILNLAENFTRNEIIPVAGDYDKSGEFPWPVIKKAHEIGLMNLHIPTKYGGEEVATIDF